VETELKTPLDIIKVRDVLQTSRICHGNIGDDLNNPDKV